MSKTVQWKRGNTTVSSVYVGAVGEITINTDSWNIYAHDGVTPGGHLTGNVVANLSYYNNDVGYITLAEVPTQISYFNNDVGYTVVGANVSDFTNDANYVSAGANISVFNNNVGYITQANVPTNVSAFTNDANYVSSGSNITVFNNNANYVSVGYNPFNQTLNTNSSVTFANLTITGNITSPSGNIGIGNLYVVDQTIYGGRANADIVLTPNGSGTVFVPSLTLPVGSLMQETEVINVPIADLILDLVTDYSVGSETLPAGNIGNPDGIAAPWAIYRFTTTPTPPLQVDDVIGGAGVPINSVIVYVGADAYSAYVVTDKVFPLGVPTPGTTITVDRPAVNASLSIVTAANVDIALNTGGGTGVIIPHSNIIPISNNIYSLGSPTKRFQQLWLGGGTIFIADPVLGVDIALSANNGNLVVEGGRGISAGEFTFFDNEIVIKDPTRNVIVGQPDATGYWQFNRPLKVVSGSTGLDSFDVSRDGLVTIKTPQTILTTQSALEIIGTTSGNSRPRNFTGTLLQLTAQDGQAARVSIDAFGGNAAYPLVVGRHARGTVDLPTATQTGDTLFRISTQGYGDSGYVSSIGRINLQATQNFTDAHGGTRLRFQTTPNNSIAIQTVTADIDSDGLSLVGNPTGGITFSDSTRQITAFSNTSAVTKIIAGSGLTQTANVGTVGLDATGVLNVAGTANQINVSDAGSKNLTLSLPQSISSNATVTFANLTITGNLTVAGNITTSGSSAIESKILYLANTSTSASQIDGGGIILGKVSDPYSVSILYNLDKDYWDTDGAGLKTLQLFSLDANISGNLNVEGTSHIGAINATIDYPDADLQVDADINSYSQIIHQNHNAGTSASTDFVAVNDIGNDSVHYIDMGINSSNYANNDYSMGGPNDGYLYVNGGNLSLGTQNNNSIVFHAGGTQSNNVIGTANSSGFYLTNVTVGNLFSTNLYGTTTNITEGTQLYFTNARARTAISVTGNLTYSNVTGVIGYTTPANISYFFNDVPYTTISQMAANVAGANAAIVTANSNMKSYVDNSITTVNGNIVTANNNVVAYVNSLNTTMAANVAGANLAIITANNAMKVYVDNQTYTNVNVSNYLSNYNGNISTTGNITGNYIFGNIAFTTGIPTYSNANVAAYLPIYAGNVGAGNITATGNINGSYFFGNGAYLTGLAIASTYGNANVAAYLPADATIIAINGNVAGANAAIVTANNGMRVYVDNKIFAVNSNLTTANSNMKSYVDNQTYTNANVAAYLPTYTGNISAGNVTATGNISGTYIFGNIALATGIQTYGNANVAAYLSNYTGNISTTGNITGANFFGNGSALTGVGTVTRVGGSGTVSGLTLSGNVTTAGNLTLSGTLVAVTSLTSNNNIILSASTGNVVIQRVDGVQSVVTGNSAATYNVTLTDQYVGTTRSATGTGTVTLPLGSTVTVGRQYTIKDEGGSSGSASKRITVAASGSDTIDGSATRNITSNYGALTVLWTGTRWSVI